MPGSETVAERPQLWIVAGPNGAGKTTCVEREPILRLLPQVRFLNPDALTLRKLKATGYRGFSDAPVEIQRPFFEESADEVQAILERAIEDKEAIGVETVLSTLKYQTLVERVKESEGFVGLIYIALASPELAVARVAKRVQEGGHGVPERKIVERWGKSLTHLTWFARNASRFWVIDNSDSQADVTPTLLAEGDTGFLTYVSPLAFPQLRNALEGLPHRS